MSSKSSNATVAAPKRARDSFATRMQNEIYKSLTRKFRALLLDIWWIASQDDNGSDKSLATLQPPPDMKIMVERAGKLNMDYTIPPRLLFTATDRLLYTLARQMRVVTTPPSKPAGKKQVSNVSSVSQNSSSADRVTTNMYKMIRIFYRQYATNHKEIVSYRLQCLVMELLTGINSFRSQEALLRRKYFKKRDELLRVGTPNMIESLERKWNFWQGYRGTTTRKIDSLENLRQDARSSTDCKSMGSLSGSHVLEGTAALDTDEARRQVQLNPSTCAGFEQRRRRVSSCAQPGACPEVKREIEFNKRRRLLGIVEPSDFADTCWRIQVVSNAKTANNTATFKASQNEKNMHSSMPGGALANASMTLGGARSLRNGVEVPEHLISYTVPKHSMRQAGLEFTTLKGFSSGPRTLDGDPVPPVMNYTRVKRNDIIFGSLENIPKGFVCTLGEAAECLKKAFERMGLGDQKEESDDESSDNDGDFRFGDPLFGGLGGREPNRSQNLKRQSIDDKPPES